MAAAIVTQGVNEVTVTARAAPAAVTGDVRVASTSGGLMVLADAFEYLWLDAPVQLDPVNITPSNLVARWQPVPAATGHDLDAGPDTNFAAYHPGFEKLDVALEVRNDSGLDAIGVRVLFTNLMPGITVENQTGTSADGRPMIEMQTAFPNGAALGQIRAYRVKEVAE